jgi:hypothetical protein
MNFIFSCHAVCSVCLNSLRSPFLLAVGAMHEYRGCWQYHWFFTECLNEVNQDDIDACLHYFEDDLVPSLTSGCTFESIVNPSFTQTIAVGARILLCPTVMTIVASEQVSDASHGFSEIYSTVNSAIKDSNSVGAEHNFCFVGRLPSE